MEKVFALMRRAVNDPEGLKQEWIVEAKKTALDKLREDLAFLRD
jgi:hypothetical protein